MGTCAVLSLRNQGLDPTGVAITQRLSDASLLYNFQQESTKVEKNLQEGPLKRM